MMSRTGRQRLIAGLSLILIGILAGCQDRARPIRWEPYSQGLPTYGLAVTVAVQPGVIYVGTYDPPALWRSEDDGQTWLRDDGGLNDSPVFVMYWDPLRSRWWAGTGNGLYTRLAASEPWRPTGPMGHAVYAVTQDSAGRLYLALGDGSLFRSANGETWTPLPIGEAEKSPTILAVAVSSDGHDLWAGMAGQGLWVSRDAGATWSSVADPSTALRHGSGQGSEPALSAAKGQALANEYVAALLVEPKAGAWVYASTAERVYRSTDGGGTWAAVPGLAERAYAFAVGADGTHYAALRGWVAHSSDGGQTWASSGTGLRPEDRVLDLAVSPADPTRLYAAAGDGLYRSTDGGQTWTRCSEGLGYPDVNALAWDGSGGLLAGTRSGIYRRTTDQAGWELCPGTEDRQVLALAQAGDGRNLYAGTAIGLLRSQDGGLTWGEVVSSLTGHGMPGLAVDHRLADHLYIRLAFERVYESWDGGRTWIARWEGLGIARQVACLTLDPAGPLFAGANDGLFRWEADKETWQAMPLPLSAPTIFVVLTHQHDPTVIYVGATDGLWRSTDGGATWSRWGQGLAGTTVTTLAWNPANERNAYAGTRYKGLYVTHDAGATWRSVWNGRLSTATVRAILFSPDGRTVYVATDQGIWRGGPHETP